MKKIFGKKIFGILLIISLVVAQDSVAQRRRMPPEERRPERIEKFKAMRLIEILKLSDEDAARFTAKKRVHDENIANLMKSRNEAIDDLEDKAGDKSTDSDLQKRIDQVLDNDQKIFTERQRYQDEMRKFLNAEQFAKFIVFERNFNRRLRDAVGEMRDRTHERGRY
ncbi:MAG: hypothetical protein HY033_08700 [Ignavibacteriae bacterium]|nr:hypothetical protein [Ignavibacteria bacterium]MBI3364972.1 hypothetical protein [Ignavibacteriota bacterium]